MEERSTWLNIFNMDSLNEVILEVNWIVTVFVIFMISVLAGGTVVNVLQSIAPKWFLQLVHYGKMGERYNKVWYMTILEVPKKWFVHFYIFGSCLITVLNVLLWQRLSQGKPGTHWISTCLDYLTTPKRVSVDATSIVVANILFTLHMYRRLYENLFVSKSSSATMNAVLYIVGYVHYIGVLVTLLSADPSLNNTDQLPSFTPLSTNIWIGIVIFIAAIIFQHDSLRRLASLRKVCPGTEDGTKKSIYSMPVGGGFEWVSCPHMLAEIFVYVSLLFILSGHTGWMVVTAWVVVNQVNIAILNHQWYKETFKDYPLKRQAIIPFLI
ncbi:polyprenal reductase isoform X3 [Oratosquilla oratoria]|uniref:polyprenal reductase isoform X3 n=1 Tax=Oratosquilla oratoria TaxID=337810 RepID=UPI003F769B2F